MYYFESKRVQDMTPEEIEDEIREISLEELLRCPPRLMSPRTRELFEAYDQLMEDREADGQPGD